MRERKKIRLKGYDYSKDNFYFVTSCVHDRICYFGEIIEKQMILNQYGQIAQKQFNLQPASAKAPAGKACKL